MFLIAEIGQAHDGSLGQAHSYVEALRGTGVDAIKFQTHIAEAESSIHEPFRVKFSKQDATRMDYWKRMEFTELQWIDLKKHCDDAGLEFMSSPFSCAAVDLLERVGVKRYKIGSGEVNNFLLLKKIAQTGKPIILSSGMSSLDELDCTFDFLLKYNNHVSLLQCTTAYPSKPKQWGLDQIPVLKDRYKIPVGYSDHSGDIFAAMAAAALGAEILEFHVVFHRLCFGPDSNASILIDDIPRMVNGVRQIFESLNHKSDKANVEEFSELKRIFEKSLAVNKDLPEGHVLTFDDLESKKPSGMGIPASRYYEVLGKKISIALSQWSFLNEDNLL